MEEIEQSNKENLKEILEIKSKAYANELDIRGIKKKAEKHSLTRWSMTITFR